MSKLSVTEFKDLISDGAIVYCTNKEDCLEVVDYLRSLGFQLYKGIEDFSLTETFLCVGYDHERTDVVRYQNSYIENAGEEGFHGTIICFSEVPFKEVCSQQSDEDFNECFTRFLLT